MRKQTSAWIFWRTLLDRSKAFGEWEPLKHVSKVRSTQFDMFTAPVFLLQNLNIASFWRVYQCAASIDLVSENQEIQSCLCHPVNTIAHRECTLFELQLHWTIKHPWANRPENKQVTQRPGLGKEVTGDSRNRTKPWRFKAPVSRHLGTPHNLLQPMMAAVFSAQPVGGTGWWPWSKGFLPEGRCMFLILRNCEEDCPMLK
jgi:hypothetical protein